MQNSSVHNLKTKKNRGGNRKKNRKRIQSKSQTFKSIEDFFLQHKSSKINDEDDAS